MNRKNNKRKSTHPAKPGNFKIVTRAGLFWAAPVGDNSLPEADVSKRERAHLATRVGLVNGQHPGLLQSWARGKAKSLEDRSRQNRRRR